MFGLFKKKKTPIDAVFDAIDVQSVQALGGVSKILNIQVLSFRNRTDFTDVLQSRFARGYLFGFFDATLQRLGLPHKSEEEAMLRIIAGHSFVFYDLELDAIQYVKNSVHMQSDPVYQAAHAQGVSELFECFCNAEHKPMRLAQYFYERG